MVLIEDIVDYLNGNDHVPRSQNVIGFKMLFRGYIVKDWFGTNSDETKYSYVNQLIVRCCVRLYHKCWLQRNDTMKRDEKLKEWLLEEVEEIKKIYEISDKIGVKAYIRNCPSNMPIRSTEYISKWIRGYNLISKSSEKYRAGDIRAYLPWRILIMTEIENILWP